jgi:EmrB/QacA subfamily drug resistance transporter
VVVRKIRWLATDATSQGAVERDPTTQTAPVGNVARERPRRPFLALLVASCGFVIVLDSFAANVAFPRIISAFSETPRSTLAWVTTGYSIALAALLLVAGALGDRHGRRRVFLVGMAAFAIGGLLSALAPNPAWLIAARVAQGCAGALMVSTSIALGIAEYPAERRGLAMGWMGVMGSIASLIGPVVAGNIITIGGSWRWVFVVPLPIAVVVLIAGPRLLSEGRDPGADRQPIDWLGVLLVVAASGLLTFAIQRTGQWGWLDRRTLLVVAVSLVLGALFVRRCRRTATPLLRLSLFADRRYLVASVSQLGSQFSIFAFFFWTPLFLTNVWGWRESTVGWVVALPLLVSMSSMLVGRYADRRGYRGVLVIGGLVGAAGNLWWALALGVEPRFGARLLPGLLLFGVAISLVGISSAAAALSQTQPGNLAVANSAFQTGRRLVQTLGVAVVVALLGDRSTESVERFRLVWIVAAVGFALSSVVALWFPPHRRQTEAGTWHRQTRGEQ